ncbi:propionyl-CoA synthetase [Nocardia mexicana]|uniref:Propionyl-CoA synthetase n=1 Tax=Nocardia mexicana TaxID=279262 RepID=A0A370GRY5_9NOCA|nr:propionyl-CoA synthetase [Nocardia mexicana]RDI46465.1 propionyl-CoA synthetase [Nocardia mexicana]
MSVYIEHFNRSMNDPEEFWAAHASAVTWDHAPTVVLDSSRAPLHRWFVDGRMNTCDNALDRHVAQGRSDQAALIYDSPVTGVRETLSYGELLERVARFAGALRGFGVGVGDRVVIYMPMVPEAAVAMLACARLGAVHSVVFGGFAAAELAVRIDDATPKVIVSASCGIEPNRVIAYQPLLDEALKLAVHQPDRCIVLQRPQLEADLVDGRDVDWHAATAAAEPADCVPVAATDPLYVLYTSGTTGKPKGVVRDNGGHAVALLWSMRHIYGIEPGDVFWAASDVGWVVGHSYIVYGPLLAGATAVLYEGKPVGTPDPGAFWRVVAEHKVKTLFAAPTAFRAIKKEDPEAKCLRDHDISSLRYLFLAGERLDPDTYHWAHAVLRTPIIDHWWQTETGWPAAANPAGIELLPAKPGSATVPVPGYDIRILGEDGQEVPRGTEGAVCMKLPLPPGTLTTLWGSDQRYIDSYLSAHEGYYLTGDSGYLDEDGYLFFLGRTDDVINVAGHRLSTGVMEAVVADHPAIAECAVIGVRDQLKGQLPRALVVLKSGENISAAQLSVELVQAVRDRVGPIAAFRDVDIVPALPKTRSGKILRKAMRAIADGREEPLPATIEDPAVLDGMRTLLSAKSSGAANAR